ncbi:MAG: hypothetical protein DI537_13960 [Stutzerimonas stutzeri]|nr:MAG: hypothetical protein DI537_13960 [Stutzerimonas stutzeri]
MNSYELTVSYWNRDGFELDEDIWTIADKYGFEKNGSGCGLGARDITFERDTRPTDEEIAGLKSDLGKFADLGAGILCWPPLPEEVECGNDIPDDYGPIESETIIIVADEDQELTPEQHAALYAGFACVDCTVNTSDTNEYYMVTDEVWTGVGMEPEGGMLCIGCLEKRLKRTLTPADFTGCPLNLDLSWTKSERLLNRLGHTERLAA